MMMMNKQKKENPKKYNKKKSDEILREDYEEKRSLEQTKDIKILITFRNLVMY